MMSFYDDRELESEHTKTVEFTNKRMLVGEPL